MTRKKNSTFVGSPMADVDVDSLIYKRWIEAAVGDTALVQDKLTGLNSETNTIVHTGAAGRGCVLGVPLVNHAVNKKFTFTGSGKAIGDTRVLCGVLFVPLGEEQIVVEVIAFSEAPCKYSVYDTSYTLLDSVDGTMAAPVALSVTPGALCIVEVRVNTDDLFLNLYATETTIFAVSVHFGRSGSVAPAVALQEDSLPLQSPQSSTQAVYHFDLDDQVFASGVAVSGRTATKLNRQQNSLLEFLTGWPSGNSAYSQIDSSSTNPTTSQFHAGSRAGTDLAAEGELQFPLIAAFLGAAMTDGSFAVNAAQPPTSGLLEFYAPWVLTTAALPQNAFVQRVKMPDFQSTSSRLKAAAIGTKGPSWDAAKPWQATFSAGGAGVTGTFAGVGGGSNLVIATASAIAFTGDANANIVVALDRAAGARAIEEFALLGVVFYFEP